MPKMKQAFRAVRPDELDALRQFAARYGRKWKTELSVQWSHAGEGSGYMRFEYGPVLHRLRNELGPEWLFQFKLPEV